MKRLALLLGSLLVVSAAASAKEVVPAPVVVEEAPVQIVEKEVIVYRDKEEGFRPNGFVSLEYRYYGDTEGKGHSNEWNPNNNYTRMQLEGMINMTEKQAFEYRVRNYNSVDYKSTAVDENDAVASKDYPDTQTRLRYYYDHGNLGETSIGMTSYVQYEKAGDQSLEYQLKFDLADYMFSNDYVKTTDLVVGPRYIYKWGSGNGNDYSNTLGLYADWKTQLPWGFSTEVEIDGLHYTWYGNTDKDETTGGALLDQYGQGKYSDEIYFQVAATIYQDTNLYVNDKVSVDLHTEFGYDPYKMSNRSRYGHNEGLDGRDRDWEYTSYSARYLSDVTVSYQATDFVKVYAGLGAEYRNWLVESTEDATDWRWQPYAFAGFNVAF